MLLSVTSRQERESYCTWASSTMTFSSFLAISFFIFDAKNIVIKGLGTGKWFRVFAGQTEEIFEF